MKQFKIDNQSHFLLLSVKKLMKKEGFESPSMSDAIRYMYRDAGYQDIYDIDNMDNLRKEGK